MSHGHKRPPVHLQTIANTVVLESDIHNWGLFCTNDIPKGTLLCILRGQILTMAEYESFLASGEIPRVCFVEKAMLDNDRMVVMPFRTSYSFINHSQEKEMLSFAIKNETVEVYAATDIKKGEEIVSVYDLERHIDVLGGFRDRR